MPLWKPNAAEIAKLRARVEEKTEDEQLQDNYFFHGLYSLSEGLYANKPPANLWVKTEAGEWKRLKRKLSRREWIESFFMIRTKSGKIEPLKLNRAQRRLEAWILRMERAGVPVRIQILKARQMGFSTYIQAVMFHSSLRGDRVRSLIVADNRERSETLLQIAEVARTCMPKSKDGDVWEFKMKSAATKSLVWTEPIGSEIRITSAEAPQPGRGGTRTMAHLSEGAFWPDAHLKQMGILASVPSLPGTYVFDESTANGDIGTFRDGFWDAWHQRAIPLAKRINPWHAEFYAWWEHDEYYFSKSYGLRTGLSKELEAEILATLNDEENWLLKQTTLVRWTPDTPWEEVVDWHTGEKKWRRVGVGPQPVSIDQLAWRRFKIADKEIGGDINRFNQEYPSRPEVAFLASGRPVFDTEIVGRYLNETADPIAVGWVLEAAAEDEPESV